MAAPGVWGWALAFLAGGVWGVAFFSWGLPLTIPMRVGATIVLIGALSLASRSGLLAAGAFSLGMAVTSALLLATSGLLLVGWWGALPACALLAAVGLSAVAFLGTRR